MDETLKANIIDLLAHHNVMMLATNIQLNKKVSVAIADEIDNSYKLRALSLSGIAERIIRLLDSHPGPLLPGGHFKLRRRIAWGLI